MKLAKIIALTGVIACASYGAFAMKLTEKDNLVKERQALMKTVGGAMGLSVKMVRGAIPYDAAKVEAALRKVSVVAEKFPGFFKKGTDLTAVKSSEASPKIWENLEDFKKKSEAMKLAALKSAEAAKGGKGSLAKTLRALGGTCASCHKSYRVKKEK